MNSNGCWGFMRILGHKKRVGGYCLTASPVNSAADTQLHLQGWAIAPQLMELMVARVANGCKWLSDFLRDFAVLWQCSGSALRSAPNSSPGQIPSRHHQILSPSPSPVMLLEKHERRVWDDGRANSISQQAPSAKALYVGTNLEIRADPYGWQKRCSGTNIKHCGNGFYLFGLTTCTTCLFS